MNKNAKRTFCAALGMLGAFTLWTVLLTVIDLRPIGPEGSSVGFGGLNRLVHELTGVHMSLYTLTDWLGLIPLGIAGGFGILGLCQWIRRKRLRAVDPSLMLLGGFYLAVLFAYVGFDLVAVNYRPVLIEGRLEPSYPSSTTVLVLCVMPTAAEELKRRMTSPAAKLWVTALFTAFSLFTVVGRLLSGVHWFTDIVGAVLLSAGLVLLHSAALRLSDTIRTRF